MLPLSFYLEILGSEMNQEVRIIAINIRKREMQNFHIYRLQL